MDERMYKIAGVLADRTRYMIYDYVCSKFDGVSVQDVADEFTIHSNVARLHLTKLEDVSLIRSVLDKKTNKGGRPNKRYTVSNETISFFFPHRDYLLLTKLAMNTLQILGPAAWDAFIEQSYQYGMVYGHKKRAEHGINQFSSNEEIRDAIFSSFQELGLNPFLEFTDSDQLTFTIRNCTFRECFPSSSNFSLCLPHQKVLLGIFEAFFDHLTFKPLGRETSGIACRSCSYKIAVNSAQLDQFDALAEQSNTLNLDGDVLKELEILKSISKDGIGDSQNSQ